MQSSLSILALLLVCLSFQANSATPKSKHGQSLGNFKIGRGIADITGSPNQIGFMGYAMMQQIGAGLHFRQRARAFVFMDENQNRFVFVNNDACMTFQDVRADLLRKLEEKYGNLYNQDNVMIGSTHTHSGPAGYSRRILYDVMSFGFYEDNLDVIVNGVFNAIVQAHESMVDGHIYMGRGEIDNSNINRSPASYLMDPPEERAKYQYNTDHDMVVLKLVDNNNNELGMINWFAVHGTSMNNTNELISGDNKGYAAYLFEKMKNGNNTLPGNGPFVAAFGQSNEGDVSPNTKGAFCPDGTPCDFVHSTCGPYNETGGCIASGPGATDFESTKIIGTYQAEGAMSIYNTANIPISSGLDYRHMYIDMSNVSVGPQWTSTGKPGSTCLAALGYGFAGGTTDGPGDFPFEEGTTNTTDNPFWGWVTSFLGKPSAEQIACQNPKPILLDVSIYIPLPWVDQILPLQIFRLGQLYLIGVPAEFTTMSGRRLRDTVYQTLVQNGASSDIVVVIAGMVNSYSHYVATYEEYQLQRYEGASTLFGPHTLAAYEQEFSYLAAALQNGQSVPAGPTPPDMRNKTFTFLTPVQVDSVPTGLNFGAVENDVQSSYSLGQTASVTFWGGNPRNNFMTGSSYLTVEQLSSTGKWVTIDNDGGWDTKLYWKISPTLANSNLITITWDIPYDSSLSGFTYRIGHMGYYKIFLGGTAPYSGYSSTFTIA